MRTLTNLFAIACVAVCATQLAAEEFPYTGYVNAPNARLRSGPGTDHYATARVRIGTPLEVYRHDRDGWLAVRPTDDSFSWVRGSALVATDDKEVARVTEDDVIARVGSRFSQDQDISHVKLARGEKVLLLEPAKFKDQEGQDVWVKVRPPAGEFRWIAEKYIDRRPAAIAAKPGAVASRTPRGPDATRHPGWRTRQPIRLTAGEEEAEETSPAEEASESTADETPASEELKTLELAVSKVISSPPTDWDFDALRKKVDAISRATEDTVENAAERADARRLLKRIDRYAGLKARFKDEAPRHIGKNIAPPTVAPSKGLPALFEYAGRLVPVVSRSRRPDAPKYALTDAKGQVVCFLEESTAVALSGYVDKHVAVSGPKTFHGRLQKEKVEVRRIAQKDPISFPAGQISQRPRRDTIRQ